MIFVCQESEFFSNYVLQNGGERENREGMEEKGEISSLLL